MVALVWGDSEDKSAALQRWCADRIPHVASERGFGSCLPVGIAAGERDDDAFYGVLVFHDYQPEARTCQITVAARSPKWVFGCKPLFRYAFDGLNCFMLWTATPIVNKRAIRWNEGIGFQREAYLHHYYGPNKHALICRFLEPEYRRSRWCDRPKIEEAA